MPRHGRAARLPGHWGFLFCLAFRPVAAAEPERDLAHWLAGLSVRLPDTTLSKDAGLLGKVNVTFKEPTCRGFSIDAVTAREVALKGASPGARAVALSVQDARAQHCSNGLEVAWGSRKLNASASFGIARTAVDLTVAFDAAAKAGPVSVPEGHCSTTLELEGLHFEGASGDLLNFLGGVIQAQLEFLVRLLACSMLQQALRQANTLLEPLLRPPQPPAPAEEWLPPAAATAHLVEWREVQMLQAMPGPRRGAAAARHLAALVSQDTGRLDLSFPAGTGLLLSPDAAQRLGVQLSANLTGITAAGLGSVTELSALNPVDGKPHSLRSRFAMDALNFSGAFGLEIAPLNGKVSAAAPLLVHVNATAALRRLVLEMQAMMAADYSGLDRLTVDGLLFAPGGRRVAAATVAAAFYALNITELEARIGDIDVASFQQDGGLLGQMVASTVDTLVRAFLGASDFQNVLPNAFEAYVFPQGRAAANERIAGLLANLSADADPEGGALRSHSTKGLSSSRDWLSACFIFGAIPGGLLLYFAAVRLPDLSRRHGARTRPLLAVSSTFPSVAREAREVAVTDAEAGSGFAGTGGPSYQTAISEPQAVAVASGPQALADAYKGSMWLQIAVPALLLLNVAICFWGVFAPICDARVSVVGGILDPDKPVANDSLLVYSFFEMVSDFWDSGATLISISLLLGGLVVPQAKGFGTLLLWAVPVNVKWRGRALEWFDLVGRFSLTNQVFITLVVQTLHTQISIPGLQVSVVAKPIRGIVSASLGLIPNMLSGHLVLHLHRRAAVREAMRPGHGVLRRTALTALAFILVTSALLVAALCAELVHFTVSGLGGDVEASAISTMLPVRRSSLVELASILYGATDEKVNAVIIGSTLVAFGVVAPVACCLVWLLMWGWALQHDSSPHLASSRMVRWAAAASPYLYCWCAVDVAFISAAVASLEMNLPVQWIVKDKAGPLCNQVQSLLGEPCVHVAGDLGAGAWCGLTFALLSGALFLSTAKAFPAPLRAAAAVEPCGN